MDVTGPEPVSVVLVMSNLHILLLRYQQASLANAQAFSSYKIT
jgi:hypothetical protein